MLKKTIIAATALVASFVAFQPVEQAEARVNIGVHLGGGYYGSGYYAPRPHYYAPRPHYYAPRPHYVPRVSYCSQARRNIRNRGYYKIRAVDCSGSRYTFFAKRGGQHFRLRVKARSGHIYKVTYR